MSDTWINHGVYPLLERIGNFHIYFGKAAAWIAGICLLITLLMAVIKIFLGITDAREQVIKMGVSLCLYFILMYIYPLAMKAILPFAMNLGYGAVFGTSSSVSVDDKYSELGSKGSSKASFYKWVGENTGDIFSSSENKDEQGKAVSVALNMNIVDAKTGYIDLNKYILYIVAFLKIGFHAIPKISFFSIDLNLILCCFAYFLAVIVAVVCMFVVLVNYIMCLLDYFSLMGFGILMIPLSLWDGTKSYTEKLYGSIGSILIKMLVISSFMCLAVIEMIDFFVEVYMSFLDVGLAFSVSDSFKLVELAVTLVLKGFLIAVLTMQTTKIAGFLNGASPSMSFGEAAIGAGQTAAMVAGAGALSKGVANMRGNAVSGGFRSAFAMSAARQSGASRGEAFKSGLATAGSSIGKSLSDGIKNAPSALKSATGQFSRMTNMGNGLSAEGFGGYRGGSSGGGGGSGGGSSLGGGSDIPVNNQFMGSDKTYKDQYDQVKHKQSLESNGADSVYGKADVTRDERGNVNGYNSTADSLIGRGGQLAESSSYLERKKGAVLGMAGSIMKSVSNARSERDKGNVMGNSTLSAVGRGIQDGMSGVKASASNAGGGMKMRLNPANYTAKTNNRGSTHISLRQKSNEETRSMQNLSGSRMKKGFEAKEDK